MSDYYRSYLEKKMSDIDHELEETALLEESGGENEIETETNETAGDEENDPVSSKTTSTSIFLTLLCFVIWLCVK